MRKSRVLKPFAVAAGISVLAFPAFAHSTGGSDRAGSFRTGPTGTNVLDFVIALLY